jgi:hypothetical protein
LHIIADARHFGHSAISAGRAELRSFALKNSQTVETTVKNVAASRVRVELSQGSYLSYWKIEPGAEAANVVAFSASA